MCIISKVSQWIKTTNTTQQVLALPCIHVINIQPIKVAGFEGVSFEMYLHIVQYYKVCRQQQISHGWVFVLCVFEMCIDSFDHTAETLLFDYQWATKIFKCFVYSSHVFLSIGSTFLYVHCLSTCAWPICTCTISLNGLSEYPNKIVFQKLLTWTT